MNHAFYFSYVFVSNPYPGILAGSGSSFVNRLETESGFDDFCMTGFGSGQVKAVTLSENYYPELNMYVICKINDFRKGGGSIFTFT